MKLYDGLLSGNAYKARLLLSLLGLEHELVNVDLARGENRTVSFLKLNPRGQIPVLVDGDVTIWDSQAVLVYLARRYGDPHWYPLDPVPLATVNQWLAFSENECLFGMARARAVKVFNRPFDFDQCQEYALSGLRVLDAHLADRDWLATDEVTVADIACYPYVGLIPVAEINLYAHENVVAWMKRIQRLPGYIDMPGIDRIA
ncbi:MAG: glutathione S-transferase family protein [Gammaproteobacteria bacterium]|nr:glutathione S-transferase family protein [Gammaproteobacteria bacterium]